MILGFGFWIDPCSETRNARKNARLIQNNLESKMKMAPSLLRRRCIFLRVDFL